jgi:hypothetical protein
MHIKGIPGANEANEIPEIKFKCREGYAVDSRSTDWPVTDLQQRFFGIAGYISHRRFNNFFELCRFEPSISGPTLRGREDLHR